MSWHDPLEGLELKAVLPFEATGQLEKPVKILVWNNMSLPATVSTVSGGKSDWPR